MENEIEFKSYGLALIIFVLTLIYGLIIALIIIALFTEQISFFELIRLPKAWILIVGLGIAIKTMRVANEK